MTRERAKELAPIIKAYGEGERVQAKQPDDSIWCEFDEWDFSSSTAQYRIAPEPRKRPMTRDEVLDFLAEHPNALVRIDTGLNTWGLGAGFTIGGDIADYSYCLVENGVRSEPRKFEIEEGGE